MSMLWMCCWCRCACTGRRAVSSAEVDRSPNARDLLHHFSSFLASLLSPLPPTSGAHASELQATPVRLASAANCESRTSYKRTYGFARSTAWSLTSLTLSSLYRSHPLPRRMYATKWPPLPLHEMVRRLMSYRHGTDYLPAATMRDFGLELVPSSSSFLLRHQDRRRGDLRDVLIRRAGVEAHSVGHDEELVWKVMEIVSSLDRSRFAFDATPHTFIPYRCCRRSEQPLQALRWAFECLCSALRVLRSREPERYDPCLLHAHRLMGALGALVL